jgi:large subunit ribosomal protein L19e
MKTLRLQKRLAAETMNVGLNRVWFDYDRINEIKEAITKSDVEALIKDGAIKKKSVQGVKRRAGREREMRKKKGRGRGTGRKRMTIIRKKKGYAYRIRKIRKHLNVLKNAKIITKSESGKLRRLAKAGIIKNKKDIREKIKK